MVHIGNSWDDVLKGEFDKDYYLKLREFLKQEYGSRTIYPNMYDIFNALKFTPYEDVKAVILGQDPYHEPGPGSRALLFGAEGCAETAFAGEYF